MADLGDVAVSSIGLGNERSQQVAGDWRGGASVGGTVADGDRAVQAIQKGNERVYFNHAWRTSVTGGARFGGGVSLIAE